MPLGGTVRQAWKRRCLPDRVC